MATRSCLDPSLRLLPSPKPRRLRLSSADPAPSPSPPCLSSQATASSLKDPSPNWSNRPPKETILLDGCDFEHWLVVVDPPQGDLTRDEIIDGYVKTLAQIVGSEEEARMKIYSVSHRCYFAFGALVSEDLSHKLKELPNVRWVLPDSYLDVRNKDYGGEPFIDGRAVPYDHKYHEEWIRNNARANDKNKRNDHRPRNFDKKRRDNMSGGSPPQRPPMGGPPPPQNYGGPPPPPNNMGGQRPPPNFGGAPPPNYGGAPPLNYGGATPQNNMGGGPPPNAGWSGNNYQQQSGGMQQSQYQNNYPPNRDGSGNPYQG
ncbi:BnaA01g29060D [Brassica napus]|uniref:BnaA01g29060D protein n=1 Tax=Brassica napus TaxID=3708 RepID=A0A078G425_BRANA|nr:BnaA01g29060D [Brassica napus]